MGQVIKQGTPAIINDAQNHPLFYVALDEILGQMTRTILCVPLIAHDAVIGAIQLINKKKGSFTKVDLTLLSSVASSIAVAIDNATLYRQQGELVDQVRQSQAQLIQAEKMGALGRLVASISHEINNPIQAIQNCLTLAMEELDDKGFNQEIVHMYLNIVKNEFNRVATIVRNMRDFYRPAAAGMALIGIHEVLESVLQLASKQLQQSNVVVMTQWAKDVPLKPI